MLRPKFSAKVFGKMNTLREPTQFNGKIILCSFQGRFLDFILCIRFKVSGTRDGKIVDGKCHSLTASFIREKHQRDDEIAVCNFYEEFETHGKEIPLPAGVYDLVGN